MANGGGPHGHKDEKKQPEPKKGKPVSPKSTSQSTGKQKEKK